jgi:hypothetical protein
LKQYEEGEERRTVKEEEKRKNKQMKETNGKNQIPYF